MLPATSRTCVTAVPADLLVWQRYPVLEVPVFAASGISLAGLKNSSVKPGTGQGFFPGEGLVLPLEKLNSAFMLLGFFPRSEGSQVSPFPSLRVQLPRVKPVLTAFQFSDHILDPAGIAP